MSYTLRQYGVSFVDTDGTRQVDFVGEIKNVEQWLKNYKETFGEYGEVYVVEAVWHRVEEGE